MSRPDHLNRISLSLVGLLLVSAGGYGLAQGHQAFGVRQQHDPVLMTGLRTFASDHHVWFWWAAAALSVVVALLGLAWLRAQLHFTRPANEDLTRTDTDGTTIVHGDAAANALAADVEALPGVASSVARVWGDSTRPSVYLRVQFNDDAPVDNLRNHIETENLERLREALQVDGLDATLDLGLVGPERRTVD